MKALIRIFTDQPYNIKRKDYPSLQHIRGTAKRHLRETGLLWTYAIIFLEDDTRLRISQNNGHWVIETL